MRVVNRISVADVLRGAKIDKNEAQNLYLIMGKARDVKTGRTQYGDYNEFFGAFEARRLIDGEIFTSGRVIFPPPTDAVVENIFDAAKKADPSAEVAFAFIIGTEEHKHGDEVKFRYTCEPIPVGDSVVTDPLADIKAAISAAKPQLLPAPGSSAAISEPSAEAGGKGKSKAA